MKKFTGDRDTDIANATAPIFACDASTCYSPDGLLNMERCAIFVIDALSRVNDTVVKTENIIGKPIDLHVVIDGMIYCHNSVLIFADGEALRFLKGYMTEAAADAKKSDIEREVEGVQNRVMDMRIGGNGYGTAVVCNYDSFQRYYK